MKALRSKKSIRIFQTIVEESINNKNKQEEEVHIEDTNFKEIIKLMEKNHRSRHENEIINNYLKTLTGLVDFLKQTNENYINLLTNISSVIKSEKVTKNRLLFHYGDLGDKFYLVLKGKVSVIIPILETVELSEDEYKNYLYNLKKYDEFELLGNVEKMNHEILPIDLSTITKEQISRSQSPNKTKIKQAKMTDVLKEEKKIARRLLLHMSHRESFANRKLESNSINLNYFDFLYPRVKPPDEYVYKLNLQSSFKKSFPKYKLNIYKLALVKVINEGEKFGEIALQRESGKRLATLITSEDCVFGVLDKHSFDKCLNKIFEKIKRSAMNNLMNFAILNHINKFLFIKTVFENFNHSKIVRNDYIVRENDERNDVIYLLTEGEYEVTMNSSILDMSSIIRFMGCYDYEDLIEIQKAESKIVYY